MQPASADLCERLGVRRRVTGVDFKVAQETGAFLDGCNHQPRDCTIGKSPIE